jgi:hypothetical protein
MSKNFNIGDWVTYHIEQNPIGKVVGFGEDNFVEINIGNSGSLFVPDKYLEQWKPKEGDLCWFSGGTYGIPTVMKFLKKQGNRFYGYKYDKFNPYYFTDCEPFFGELPSFLMDLK